jgi:hypothetical protein
VPVGSVEAKVSAPLFTHEAVTKVAEAVALTVYIFPVVGLAGPSHNQINPRFITAAPFWISKSIGSRPTSGNGLKNNCSIAGVDGNTSPFVMLPISYGNTARNDGVTS